MTDTLSSAGFSKIAIYDDSNFPGKENLTELSGIAFEQENDDKELYDRECRSANSILRDIYPLGNLKFYFMYDFGDEWIFMDIQNVIWSYF